MSTTISSDNDDKNVVRQDCRQDLQEVMNDKCRQGVTLAAMFR